MVRPAAPAPAAAAEAPSAPGSKSPARRRLGTPPASTFDPSDWPIAWMARAERQHARNATQLLAPLGIHHREFRLLALLGAGEGLPIGELAERAVLERPTVSKMVDRLEAVGLIARGAHEVDRRCSPLVLTDTGRAKLAAAAPIVEALFQRYQAGIPPADHRRFMRELKDFFERVRAARPAAR
jgi:DNA-binding MarR family transcriptional regulator